ncbi:MAG: zf-HC2 domain-containing protein [Polyangiales bacterium]|nr:zf-HC2 domain-containing protein [Myxococcales bacterium]MCB9662221.1 zf-HC2 domain-containing protein [Sandaracinaceae bacterium]
MKCELVQRHMGALVDGELDPATQIEFERHVDACADCQELVELDRLIRHELRARAEATVTPSSLEERVRLALQQAPAQRRAPFVTVSPVPLKQAVPMMAAAAALFVVVGGTGVTDDANVASASMLEDVVQLHSSELPSDVRDAEPTQVSRYFRGRVAFPVRPARFDRQDARLVGARLSTVRAERAAALYYEVQGRRVTVVVFPSSAGPIEAAPVRLGDRDLFYGSARGYAVPVRQLDGLTYAFTGDLDRESLMRLAASAQVSP